MITRQQGGGDGSILRQYVEGADNEANEVSV